MTDYVSSIGLPGQAGYDYTDLQDWMGDADDGSYNAGDRLIAVLSNNTTGVTTGDKYHRLRLQRSSLNQWSTTNHVEVIISGTNADRSTPFVEPWVRNSDIHYIMSDNGEKTYKFIDLDVSNVSRLRINSSNGRSMTESVSNCTVVWSGCRIVQDNSVAFMEDFMGDCSAASGGGAYTRFKFYNCSIDARQRRLTRSHPTLYTIFFMTVEAIGCSIRSLHTDETFSMTTSNNPTGYWQCLVSGSMYDDNGQGQALARRNPDRAWHVAGSATDYITKELSDSTLAEWADTNLINVSDSASFQYGDDGAGLNANTVGFSALYNVTGPTYALGDVVDHRLWGDSNNIAFDYVTNVTLPSPDLGGTDRGVAPFDAGAFEFNVNSGGADVTAAFGNVYVRLY